MFPLNVLMGINKKFGKSLKKSSLRITKEEIYANMPELTARVIEGDIFYYALTFDVDDFIGDGIWWLEIYDSRRNIIYNKPFASSVGQLDIYLIDEIIKKEFLIRI
jgi:hypothetical protein